MADDGASSRALCFVLMPFGTKEDAHGRRIDFDVLYTAVIRPAIEAAGMVPVRADEERGGGIIHKPMFERLVLCAFAVADLTLANANVFYELGVRHAVRPHTTVLLFEAGGQRMPFDVAPLRALPYRVDSDGAVVDPDRVVASIVSRLDDARDPTDDSPLYQLLDGMVPPDVARLKTDVFRDRVRYSEDVKARLRRAVQAQDAAEVDRIRSEVASRDDVEAGVLVDLLLSYRDVGAYAAMEEVVEAMPEPLRDTVLVREQLAFGLNRLERGEEAEQILRDLIASHGASSETYGLLGRVLKDRWERAVHEGSPSAPALLGRAIDAYTQGFEADWRDAFPGVNALTLLDVQASRQSELARLLPVVRYAVERRLASPHSDYWDHASMLELAVLAGDPALAKRHLAESLACDPPGWQLQTTARNLRLLQQARRERGEDTGLVDEVLASLAPQEAP